MAKNKKSADLFIMAPTPEVLANIGNALGDCCDGDEEGMRHAWGDATVDWLLAQEDTNEYQHWLKKQKK